MKFTTILLLACCFFAHSITAFTFNLRDEIGYENKYESVENSKKDGIWPEKNEHGFIPVGNDGSDMFYWYFPARENPDKAPQVVWLTGGPGCSSELAIFYENGPFQLTQKSADTTLMHNKFSWNTRANMLYIDSPVGTGFSKAAHDWSLKIFQRQVAENITEQLLKFIANHPEQTKRALYLTGESYAGKYVPFLGKYLDDISHNETAKSLINFKGIAVGNGLVYPTNQYDSYVSFSYNNGLINEHQRQEFQAAIDDCKKVSVPFQNRAVCEKAMGKINDFVDNMNQYDIRKKCVGSLCYNMDSLIALFKKPEVIADLGIQDRLPYELCSDAVNTAQYVDFDTDASIAVAQLLENNYRVFIYYGDKDYACNWEGGYSWVTKMNWNGASSFNKKKLEDCEYGSCQEFANLKFIKVANSGHQVPQDQPEKALDMLDEFLGFK